LLKFSVVIPTFNKPGILGVTLKYLNQQRGFRNDFEVIIIDDGSPDNSTREIFLSLKDRVSYNLQYVYLERTSDSCTSRARNAGISRATGEIIIFLDDDILVDEDFLAEHARFHDIYGSLLVIGYRRFLNREITDRLCSAPDLLPLRVLAENSEEETRHVIFKYFITFNMSAITRPWIYVFSCILSAKRKSIAAINAHFDEDYKRWGVEDVDFGYQFYINGYPVVVNPRLETYHLYHGESRINSQKWHGMRINDNIFREKHGFFCMAAAQDDSQSYSPDRVGDLLTGNVRTKLYILRNEFQAEHLKKALLKEVAQDKKFQAVIFDEVNSNLDLWVQLVKFKTDYPLMYYPASSWLAASAEPLLDDQRIEKAVF
jgi:glycosyltransferase involved in cell wall biosynthesis